MAEIELHNVYKVGSKELRSGDFQISFQIDSSLAQQLLPFHLLKQKDPLVLKISDGTPVKVEADPEQEKRKKLYAQIEIHLGNAGYNEESKRTFFYANIGKKSKKDMTLNELETLEKAAYKEANPLPEEQA